MNNSYLCAVENAFLLPSKSIGILLKETQDWAFPLKKVLLLELLSPL